MVKLYVYQSNKCLEGNPVLPKFYDICSNHDLLVLFGNEKKLCLKVRVKTKKSNHFESVSEFSIFDLNK